MKRLSSYCDFRLLLLLSAALVLFSAAYQVRRPVFLDIGGPYDTPETPGFYAPEKSADNNSYRWAAANSRLLLPGLGAADLRLTLQLSSGRAAGSPPLPVAITINGHSVGSVNLQTSSDPYSFDVPGAWMRDGDLVVDFSSPTFINAADKRSLGFVADFARIEWRGAPVFPAPSQLFYLLAGLIMLYWLVILLGFSQRAALLVTGISTLAFTAVLAVAPLLLTVFSERIVALLIITLPSTSICSALTGYVLRRLGYWKQFGDAVGRNFVRSVATLFAVSVLLKVGGLLYPHTFIVDAYFHLKQLQYAIEGRLQNQDELALAVMPADEWVSRSFIPYSPFFYAVFAWFGWLPWSIALWVPVFMGWLDAVRVPLVALLALVVGPGPKRAFWAALVFTFIPATFLVQQWGNWPTQLSLWLTLAWLTVVVLAWNRPSLRGPLPNRWSGWVVWLVASFLLGLTLLSYTVTAVYVGSIFGAFILLGLWRLPDQRKKLTQLLLQFVPAIIFALVAFYGPQVIKVITVTIPSFSQTMGSSGTLTVRDGWGAFFNNSVGPAMVSYSLDRVYVLALAGVLLALVVAFMGKRGARAGIKTRPLWATWLLLVWLASMPLFLFADYYVDQALKEYWFPLPAVAVLGGTWLLSLWDRRGASRMFATVFIALLTWSSVSLWVFRLLIHSRS